MSANFMDRIRFMKERVVNTVPEMDLENAHIMTESFKETAGEPLCIQKAKAFRRQCRQKTVSSRLRKTLKTIGDFWCG